MYSSKRCQEFLLHSKFFYERFLCIMLWMPFAISDKDRCCSVHSRFRDDILAEIRVNVFKKNFINFRFQLVNCQLSQICRKGCIVNVFFFTVNAVFLLVKTIYYVIICHHKFVTIHFNVQYAFSSLTQKNHYSLKNKNGADFFQICT